MGHGLTGGWNSFPLKNFFRPAHYFILNILKEDASILYLTFDQFFYHFGGIDYIIKSIYMTFEVVYDPKNI